MIRVNDGRLRIGGRVLFEQASFSLHPGWRVGITGANGTGKSSFLSLVRGDLQLDSGEISRPLKWRLSEVAQEISESDKPVLQWVIDGDKALRKVEADIAAAQQREDGHEAANLLSRYEELGGYTANTRASKLLAGLGFEPEQRDKALADFSGGWQMRAALARALMCPSELMLLDEPTNHLDLDAVIWLQEWLRSYEGTLLVISHDREFLDAVAEHILHIENQKIDRFKGNYSQMQAVAAERLAQQQAVSAKAELKRAHLQSYIDRFRAQATKAKQAQSRIKALEKMGDSMVLSVKSGFDFQFRPIEVDFNPMLQLESAHVGHQGVALLANFDFNIYRHSRIGLIGPNGAGKSTLIKALAGEATLISGVHRPAKALKIGYFSQHQTEQLHYSRSALEEMRACDPNATDESLRSLLGNFGFAGDRVFETIEGFSGGEKTRLVLAKLVYQSPNLLLLDEPTNHLDLDMREALGLAVGNFDGAVVLISHDRHLLQSACDEFYLVADGKIELFDGDLDGYAQWSKARSKARESQNDTGQSEAPPGKSPDSAQRRKDAAARREALRPLTNRLKTVERDMQKLSQTLKELEQSLADPASYEAENAKLLAELMIKHAADKERLDTLESQWIELSEQIETMQ